MPYRDILVHVKLDDRASGHVAASIGLAAAHGARLTALVNLRNLAMLRLLHPDGGPDVEREATRAGALAGVIEARLRDEAGRVGVALDVQVAEGDAAELLGLAGRFHDLTIVEQSGSASDEVGWDVPEHCAVATGRPVLVIPRAGSVPAIGRRVLVAWNASREAAMAVQHALPFLAQAESVVVLQGKSRQTYPSVTRRPSLDVADHLRRYCPRVETLPEDVDDGRAGEVILAAAGRHGCDLAVMGAYGRPWLSEWVLGGATRHVLRHATVPLLLAH